MRSSSTSGGCSFTRPVIVSWRSAATGVDMTKRFAMIRDKVLSLPAASAIIDAERVACDSDGQPDFDALMKGQREKVPGAGRGTCGMGHANATHYRPDIDGLRALAVLGVVAYHAAPAWVRGGYIGVDVFVVISGFLIADRFYQDVPKPIRDKGPWQGTRARS